jgi:hypothetical protein
MVTITLTQRVNLLELDTNAVKQNPNSQHGIGRVKHYGQAQAGRLKALPKIDKENISIFV